jgi:hypothetical protein
MITWLRNLIYGKPVVVVEEKKVETPVVVVVETPIVVETQITDAVTEKPKKVRKPRTKKVK